MDRLSPDKRRKNMQKIRSKNTGIELAVRRLIYKMGFRYRLHDPTLPGTPDIVFRQRRKAIFVNGCFWHQHQGCKNALSPASNAAYWLPKLKRNTERDLENQKELEASGWDYLVVWQCEVEKYPDRVAEKISEFLGSDNDDKNSA